MKILAVVPCYNEEASVGDVVGSLQTACPEMDILVVNDGSRDRTAEAAAAAGAKVAQLPYNMGIGAAMQTGFLYAKAHGYDIAVQVDGDGQHDPAEVGKLLKPIQEGRADIVVGSRFISGGGFKSTPMRRLGIKAFARVLTIMTGQTLTDPTSGFRAAGKKVISLFSEEYPQDYPEVESLLLVHLANLRIAEERVVMRARSGGRSSITPLKSAYYMVKVMMVLFIWLIRKKPKMEA
jgi:glycosyltransferase involved in cell wall biosynthesis